jgi:hypothetical protein
VTALAWIDELARLQAKGERKRLMVSVDGELSGLDHMPEVPHCPVHGQELPVERAVHAFGRAEFLRVELKRFPGAIKMLL